MARGDYALVTHPDKQPAVDFVTRNPAGPFVDTGLDVRVRPRPGAIEVTERVYLAESTIRQLSEVAGILESDRALRDEQRFEAGRQSIIDALEKGGAGELVLGIARRAPRV